MENKFLKALDDTFNTGYTENEARVFKDTRNSLLDFFVSAGISRNKSTEDIVFGFYKAYCEEPVLAMKALFYARDIKEGLGERRLFREILSFLGDNEYFLEKLVNKKLFFSLISQYGRFDDLFSFVGTELEKDMLSFYGEVLFSDFESMSKGKPITLAAKWSPSINASSAETRKHAALLISNLGISKKYYNKKRKAALLYSNIVETKTTTNRWNEIELDKIPSKAFLLYKNALYRHVPEKMEQLIKDVESGNKTINSGAVYPYEIFKKMRLSFHRSRFNFEKYDKTFQAMWDSLPNFVESNSNVMVMADTSGSMDMDDSLSVSLSLAIYFAERNYGAFKNKFMTFSSNPSFISLPNNGSLEEKIKTIPSIISNTNYELAMRLILNTAIENNLSQEDLPKSLIVISDMQFDQSSCGNSKNFLSNLQDMYEKAGYSLPSIVFWNVRSSECKNSIAKYDSVNVQLVSGLSASTFKFVNAIAGLTPFEAMLTILNSSRYEPVESFFKK